MPDHEPWFWPLVSTPVLEGPGVHQIRMHEVRGTLTVACVCGDLQVPLAKPWQDCWPPFNEHLRSVNAATG